MASSNPRQDNKRVFQLTLAIQKAINSVETPVKEKHVRSTIIGTFQEQSAVTYWMVALRLPLQDNRIAAWKFCNVTHKVLREGHPACLDDSQRHIGMIENLGKLWVHLREGYGRLISLYSSLLVCKLKFHARNPRFPGNMQLTADELDNIAENDVNNYFQLCVELFDYMDDILNLQAAVFDSLGNARANSMTASGQCRLAALIPCAQDSSHIYDCNVRLLFRLHASLPPDTLAGHRERFRVQFKKLSQFYKHASSLQYYRNLLTLPVLPANPPNFLLQSDFGTYVAPVVSIPEPPPDEVDAVGSLIDTSDTISQATSPDFDVMDTRATPSPQPDPLVERDRLIEHLQNELRRMRNEMSQFVVDRNQALGSVRKQCAELETLLHETKVELEDEKRKTMMSSTQTTEIKQKMTETEEKAKVQDEKLQKFKGAYTQLREEHITLIRQKAEEGKKLANLKAEFTQLEAAKAALQQQLNDRIKDVELLQQSASSSEEIDAYKSEIISLRTDLEQSRLKETELETLKASMEALELEHKTVITEQENKLTTVTNELKEVTENLERVTQEKQEREEELTKVKEELVSLRENSGNEYKKVVEQREAALRQVNDLTEQYRQEKEEQVTNINNLNAEIGNIQQKLIENETKYITQCKQLQDELEAKNVALDVTLNQKDKEIKETLDRLSVLQEEIESLKKSNEECTKQLNEEKETINLQLQQISEEKRAMEQLITDKNSEILTLQDKIKELLESDTSHHTALIEVENTKNKIIEELKACIVENEKLISNLQHTITEEKEKCSKCESDNDNLRHSITELESQLEDKVKETNEISSKLDEVTSSLEANKLQLEALQKENDHNISVHNDKLETVSQLKDETIKSLKEMIAEKDEQVISLNVEVNKMTTEIARLEEELNEAQAELEIGKNEFVTLRDEHDNFVHRNENNLTLKNHELRSLNEQVANLTHEVAELKTEKDKLCNDFAVEKQVMENKIKTLEDEHNQTIANSEMTKTEKEQLIVKMQEEIKDLKSEYERTKEVNDNEIQELTDKIKQQEITMNDALKEKDAIIADAETNVSKLSSEIEELRESKMKEKEDMDEALTKKDKEMQLMEAKLQHSQTERLNAECELQDLLQFNAVLEGDNVCLKFELEAMEKELEKTKARLVQCASEAALEVTNEALAALDRSSALDTNKVAEEKAIQALEELSKDAEVKGREEALARSAIFVAHNTAALSAYVTEVCNVATDMDLSDKLSNECRAMLSATKQCLEAVGGGRPAGGGARLVAAVAAAARAGAQGRPGERSVDDELADMDDAIEQAASQIEKLLAASKAADSGVKLEVNSNILDACTTLMGAVKILVQDARKLQNELGDPKTRQKMYRRNPQWSEGLISAAKAVVFAAKLLVTSADEAVGAAGRAEGVSAAAHEVAGSTAQLVAASRARAPPASPALAALTGASCAVAAATGALVSAVRAAAARQHDQEALDTSALTLTATRRLEMESKVRSLELESALDAERSRLAALRKRHYQLAQMEENGGIRNGKE